MTESSRSFIVRTALPIDLPGILAVQHEAFGRVAAELSIDPEVMPPLNESLTDLMSLFSAQTVFFVAVSQEAGVVGSVRGYVAEDGAVEIGRLVVAKGWTRLGVASRLMNAIEGSFPNAERYRLFTGRDAEAPLALYSRLGYRVVPGPADAPIELAFLEKP